MKSNELFCDHYSVLGLGRAAYSRLNRHPLNEEIVNISDCSILSQQNNRKVFTIVTFVFFWFGRMQFGEYVSRYHVPNNYFTIITRRAYKTSTRLG